MTTTKRKGYPKVGVAFSGGSALGLCHIGVLKSLMENRIPIDCVSGTSAGAIVAAGVAFGVPLKKMIALSKDLSWANLSIFGHSKMGINSNEPVGELMRKMIGNAKIEEALIPLAIVAADIDSGEEVILRKGSVAEAVMASTCLPGFFIPVKVKRRNLVDGGLVENLPVSPLKKMGAKIRIGVDLGHWRKFEKTHNVVDVINNSYSILLKPQASVSSTDAEVLIEPHLENYTSSDFAKVKELMDAGHKASDAMISEIKRQIDGQVVESESSFRKILSLFRQD